MNGSLHSLRTGKRGKGERTMVSSAFRRNIKEKLLELLRLDLCFVFSFNCPLISASL